MLLSSMICTDIINHSIIVITFGTLVKFNLNDNTIELTRDIKIDFLRKWRYSFDSQSLTSYSMAPESKVFGFGSRSLKKEKGYSLNSLFSLLT